MKAVDTTALFNLYRKWGFEPLGTYVDKATPILCQVTFGRYEGYLAEIEPIYIRQRERIGARKEIKMNKLLPSERKRFMDVESTKRGYTIVEYPEDYLPTKRMRLKNPEGKLTNTPAWNGLYGKWIKYFDNQSRRTAIASESYVERYARWEGKYDTTILDEYTGTHNRVKFKFNSGKYEGLIGEIENAGIRDMREPTLRSLTSESVIKYYQRLCSKFGFEFIGVVKNSRHRSKAVLSCRKLTGNYQGYLCEVPVSSFLHAIEHNDKLDSLRIVTQEEQIRLTADLVNERGFKWESLDHLDSHTRLELTCPEGHQFTTFWYRLFQGHGWCPTCKASGGEQLLQTYLNKVGVSYVREHRIYTDIRKFPLAFDFYLPEYRLAIEYNGIQHYEPIEHFGGDKVFEAIKQSDEAKRAYCKSNGVTLLELPYTLSNEEVIQQVQEALEQNKK